jgi:predicted DNA-binding transcriptional regulator AlpA
MTIKQDLLRALFRELSSDDDDMMALLDSLPDAEPDDRQAFIAELTQPKIRIPRIRTKAVFHSSDRVMGPAEALRALGVPRTTFYMAIRDGGFPRPMFLDHGRIGWPSHIIEAWAQTHQCAPAPALK